MLSLAFISTIPSGFTSALISAMMASGRAKPHDRRKLL
jgi:hypothetical protein